MRTVQDVEAYLERMNRPFSQVEGQPGMFLLHGSHAMPAIALRVEAPLVVLRVNVGPVPQGDVASTNALYKNLLTLNAELLVHTSFGLEDGCIVLCSALELENLDFNELTAALDELDITIAQQTAGLAELSKAVHSTQRTA